MLAQLTEARDSAQNELATAEIALLQATAAANALREDVRKLTTAVAVMSGEAVPTEGSAESTEVAAPQTPGEPSAPSGDIHEMTPEEFDAQRKKKQRKRDKELQADSPYAEVPCSGCGTKGSLYDTVIQAPSGAPIAMLICSKCNNQLMK